MDDEHPLGRLVPDNGARVVQQGRGGRSAVPLTVRDLAHHHRCEDVRQPPPASHRADLSGRVDGPDAIVAHVGHQHRPVGAYREGLGAGQQGIPGIAAVSAEAGGPSGHRLDRAKVLLEKVLPRQLERRCTAR